MEVGQGRRSAVWVFRGRTAAEISARLREAAGGCWNIQGDGNGLPEALPLAAALVLDDHQPQAVRERLLQAAEQVDQARGRAVTDAHAGLYFEPEPPGPSALAFLFPGQGSQAIGMLGQLVDALPGVADRVAALDPQGRWRRLIDGGAADGVMAEAEAQLRDTRHAQPSIGLLSFSLAQTLAAWGIFPRFAAGHSYGELPCLAIAGAFDGATLMELSEARGRCLGLAGDAQPGAMLALRAGTTDIEALVSEVLSPPSATSVSSGAMAACEGPLVLANRNAPGQGVLSGTERAIARAEALALARQWRCTRLQTSCAFHSPLMAMAQPAWQEALAKADIHPPLLVSVVANADARPYPASADAVRTLLTEQLCSPVLWESSVHALYRQGARIFLEVGPGRTLTELTGQILKDQDHTALACDPGRADAHRHLAHLLARLTALGLRPNLGAWAYQPAAQGATSSVSTRPTMTQALDTFLNVNGQMLERFYEQQNALVGLCLDASSDVRQQLFTTMVVANQQALTGYLQTQQEAVLGQATVTRGVTHGREARPADRPVRELDSGPPVPVQAGDVIGSSEIAGAAAKGETSAPRPGSEDWFRQLIAQLTGFPAHMIRSDSDFEGDLGLDSLSMVEVWFSLVDEFPALESQRDAFRRCRCIADGVALIGGLASESVSCGEPRPVQQQASEQRPVPPQVSQTRPVEPPSRSPVDLQIPQTPVEQLRHQLRARIAAVKGLDVTSVQTDADFERDLGLDVFTRSELCDELLQRRPALAVAGRELLHAPTVDALVSLCADVLGLRRTEPGEPGEGGPASPLGLKAPDAGPPLSRLVRVDVPLLPLVPPRGTLPTQLLLVGMAGPLFDHLHAALVGQGVVVEPWHATPEGFRPTGADAAALIPMDDEAGLAQAWPARAGTAAVLFVAGDVVTAAWSECIELASSAPFILAKSLRQRELMWFGVLGSARGGPAWAAARGVARTLAREWPATRVRSLWIDGAVESSDVVRVIDVFCAGASEQDLVLRQGRVFHQRLEPRPLQGRAGSAPALGPQSTVLMLGGGDGITAEVAVALAARYRCRVALLGRTARPSSYPYPQARSDAELRAALIEELRETGSGAGAQGADSRGEVERLRERMQQVRRARAVYTTCERIEAAGGHAHHEAADATDRTALSRALARIRQACGPLHGVVHGVGLAEDALLERKSLASFRRVVRTKTESVALLRELVQDDPLQFAFLFSSLSAHAGTPGQVDYVAANEVLGAVAEDWNLAVSYPVRALLWSVWSEAGMASTALVRQMERLGLPGIRTRLGTAQFEDELTHGLKQESWALLAPETTLAYALHAAPVPVPEQVSASREENLHV